MSTTSAVIKRLRQTINDQAATITGLFREIERMLPTPARGMDK